MPVKLFASGHGIGPFSLLVAAAPSTVAAGKKTRELGQQQPCAVNYSASSSVGWTHFRLQSELLVHCGECLWGEEMVPPNTKTQQLPPPQPHRRQVFVWFALKIACFCQETVVSWRPKPGKEIGEKQKVSAMGCLKVERERAKGFCPSNHNC